MAEQVPPQGAGTEHAAAAGKGLILGLVAALEFSTQSLQAGPLLCCGCIRQLGEWCLKGLLIPHFEAKAWPEALQGLPFPGKRLMLPQSLGVHWAQEKLDPEHSSKLESWCFGGTRLKISCVEWANPSHSEGSQGEIPPSVGGCRTNFLFFWQFCWKLLSITPQKSFLCKNSLNT